jgi:hypothetical protein
MKRRAVWRGLEPPKAFGQIVRGLLDDAQRFEQCHLWPENWHSTVLGERVLVTTPRGIMFPANPMLLLRAGSRLEVLGLQGARLRAERDVFRVLREVGR